MLEDFWFFTCCELNSFLLNSFFWRFLSTKSILVELPRVLRLLMETLRICFKTMDVLLLAGELANLCFSVHVIKY